MDILAICRFFALPAVLILFLAVTRRGNYVGPKNPTPVKPGDIEIIKKVNR